MKDKTDKQLIDELALLAERHWTSKDTKEKEELELQSDGLNEELLRRMRNNPEFVVEALLENDLFRATFEIIEDPNVQAEELWPIEKFTEKILERKNNLV